MKEDGVMENGANKSVEVGGGDEVTKVDRVVVQ